MVEPSEPVSNAGYRPDADAEFIKAYLLERGYDGPVVAAVNRLEAAAKRAPVITEDWLDWQGRRWHLSDLSDARGPWVKVRPAELRAWAGLLDRAAWALEAHGLRRSGLNAELAAVAQQMATHPPRDETSAGPPLGGASGA